MKKQAVTIKYLCLMISAGALAFVMSVTATLAWFGLWRDIAAYAPISSPESLYIGAGHCDMENEKIEPIEYLYFDSMESVPETGGEYWDRVFCIYGKMVGSYHIQIAYTTNNQFRYEIFPAAESEEYSEGSVVHDIHYTKINESDPSTYYYSVNGLAITGKYLNVTTTNGDGSGAPVAVDGEVLAWNADYYASDTTFGTSKPSLYPADGADISSTTRSAFYSIVANRDKYNYHYITYGTYTNVNKYAEPIYWQTTAAETGAARDSFVHYYILRVHTTRAILNDRETDIICIAAKSVS